MSGIRINLGSGFKRIEGFVNVDADPNVEPDYLLDLETGRLPFEDNTVAEVLCSHVMEHIGAGFIPLMKEIYRVCQPNGIVHIIVPHHRSDIFFGDPTHVRPITPEMMKLFSKKYIKHHIESYGSSTGVAYKEDLDFETIFADSKIFPEWEERFKDMKPEEIRHVCTSYNNVFYETYIKLAAIKDE